MAEAASTQGGTFYKDGQYTKAQECYETAIRLSPKEPKYPSNLSAVLYEAGKYSKAITAIRLSWHLLQAKNEVAGQSPTPTVADPLAVKLAIRFAKACSHRFYSEEEPQAGDKFKDIDEEIESLLLCPADVDDVKIKDLQAAWLQWRELRDSKVQQSLEECEAEKTAARKRLRSISIFKSPEEPTLEYYTFGHDDVHSFLNGINHSLDYSLDRNKDYADKHVWSFLFGGSGDARHAFGTLVHLSQKFNKAAKLRPTNAFEVRLTLMDIHPASLARVIVVISLIQQVLHARLSKDTARTTELFTTLFYVYATYLMPDYCRQIVMDTAKALVDELPEKKNSLSECLFINEQSLPAIVDVLKYWSTPLRKTPKQFIKNNSMNCLDPYENFATSMVGSDVEQQRQKAASIRNQKAGGDIYGDPAAEKTVYERTWALIPPRSLLPRHPALAKLVKEYLSASDSLYAAAKREVEETWKVNHTIFDKYSTEHPDHGHGYPNIDADFLDTATFRKFVEEFRHGPPPSFCRGGANFTTMTHFFSLVADAMSVLQNALVVEVVVSDVMTGTAKLLAGDLGARPKNAPMHYTRAWLSNVPDYTNGLLNNVVHITPYLEPKGLVLWNCLLNTGNWKTVTDYCYNYTLLLPKDVPRFLGCKVVNPKDSLWFDVAIQKMDLPLPLEKLASKKELHDWLGHLLMSTICSGYPSLPPFKVEMPNNLGAFMHVLMHLHRVGFPPHWIGDFMQSVVSNNLVTSLEPYQGRLPVPIPKQVKSEKTRRVHLDGWHAGLQVLIAAARDALPFALSLPADFPSLSDIATYSATVTRVDLTRDPRGSVWGPLTGPFSLAVGALFFRGKGRTGNNLPEMLFGLLQGMPVAAGLADPCVQVVLGLEHVDLLLGKVSWKMGRAWHARMVREGWVMMLFRTDLRAAVTKQVDAKLWIEIV
ncbi:hypothetical protein HYPSUDRAFT_41905 [Hypholoma sublateritium FD-334 SS-4]|uniref:DUF4470 domain-containing protein n=1 Tax=Hypholoma sublateritium (strain FD-334 SS-4) TaxID=945553 RepID=A0A0D2NRW5_HYPSF|nr:hypothetical protein HYPSUDRAFT_41905 [Hypholoma sublateritium FD-334 SS-4]